MLRLYNVLNTIRYRIPTFEANVSMMVRNVDNQRSNGGMVVQQTARALKLRIDCWKDRVSVEDDSFVWYPCDFQPCKVTRKASMWHGWRYSRCYCYLVDNYFIVRVFSDAPHSHCKYLLHPLLTLPKFSSFRYFLG